MKRIPLRGKASPAPTPPPAFAERSPDKYRASQVVPPGAIFLMEEPMHGWPPGWTMKLYDIGAEEVLRVVYPDCWQIHPLAWHRDRLTAAGINFSHLERKVVVPTPAPEKMPGKKKEVSSMKTIADFIAPAAPASVQRVKLRPR